MNNELWKSCADDLTDSNLAELAAWRGYSEPFCRWLQEQQLVGRYRGMWAIPLMDNTCEVIAAHCYRSDGSWTYRPWGVETRVLVIGPIETAKTVWVFESQWDAYAAMEKTGWHQEIPAATAIVITRGPRHGMLVRGLFRPGANIYAIVQNDIRVGHHGTLAENWLRSISIHADSPIYRVAPPAAFKDINDWTKAGATGDDIAEVFRDAELIPAGTFRQLRRRHRARNGLAGDGQLVARQAPSRST